jgi:phosphoenolpyruvate carboxylase
VRALYALPREQGPDGLFDTFPELKDPETARKVARVFTVLFQLVNIAEQKEIVRANRAKARRPESLEDVVERLAEAFDEPTLRSLIESVYLCPTLTAHPTEARRRAVLNRLDAIALALGQSQLREEDLGLDRPLGATDMAETAIRRNLAALWQTDEMRRSQLTVPEEVTNALFYFERSIFDAVSWVERDLGRAWSSRFGPPTPSLDIEYRSWVGGDRDGNPKVTPEVTWQAALRHSRLILNAYLNNVVRLRGDLTNSRQSLAGGDLLEARLRQACQEHEISIPERYWERNAPLDVALRISEARLERTLAHIEALEKEPDPKLPNGAYQNAQEFRSDLQGLAQVLAESNAAIEAETGLMARLLREVRSFGFHLAALDVRQHSKRHEEAMDEMLAAGGVTAPGGYLALSEAGRTELLLREIANPRPLVPPEWKGSDETEDVRGTLRTVRRIHERLWPEAVQAYVVSMTHGASDLLEVVLFAKDAGLYDGALPFDIVPLFETIDDLRHGASVMDGLLGNGLYRSLVRARGEFQEVMLGYSDSSKDGGFFSANWGLYRGQSELAEVGRRHGVSVRFFHGRGGTVSRGGGRASRAIRSQPPGTFNGQIRFTEQGEVISFRYSLSPIAHRHLEQIVGATLLEAAEQRAGTTKDEDAWHRVAEELAERSRRAYRSLVYEDEGFFEFYVQATPIKAISQLPIASRPVMRSGGAVGGIEDLRAIPWNFAWVQSRYVLPSWFGLGTALESFIQDDDNNLGLLRTMVAQWPFFETVLRNAELELSRAELGTAAWYAARTGDRALGARIHERIEAEFRLTVRRLLCVLEQEEIMEKAQVIWKTIQLRNPAVLPLNRLQIAIAGENDARYREAALQAVAGIAAAMQSTG